MRRLILIPIGLFFAIPSGMMVAFIGALFEPAAWHMAEAFAFAVTHILIEALDTQNPPDASLVSLGQAVVWLGFLTLVAPPVVTALIGAVARLRSYVFYGGLSGLLAALVPWLMRASERRIDPTLWPAEGRLTALLFLSGATSGLVYWLVAGRGMRQTAA